MNGPDETTVNIDTLWRGRIAKRCGGKEFDKPGGGYAFSAILAEERELSANNVPNQARSALLALSIADPTWKMPEQAMKALMKYYYNSPNATRYTDNRGIPGTHEAIAEFLNKRYGVELTPDWVQYSPGAIKKALSVYVPTLLFDEDSFLLFPTPGYPIIKNSMNARGATCYDVPLIHSSKYGWELDLERLTAEAPNASGYVYVNLPGNPIGIGYSREQWEILLDWAAEQDMILIVDEAYTDLRYNDRTVSVLTVPSWEKSCVVLQSVSKGWSATGLRFGWVVGHPILIKGMRKVMDVKDSGMFGGTIAAGLECLAHPEWANETRSRYQGLHQALYDGLISAKFKTAMPEAGLCQFTPAPKSANGTEFIDALECAKWFRKHLRISLMNYTVHDEPWLRWAVTLKPLPECGLPDEAAVIAEVVRRLKETEFTF